jgi:hypothetical protein
MTRSPVSYKRHRFPPALIAHTLGCISGFRSACVWSRKCCWSAGSLFLTRPSDVGQRSSARTMLIVCAGGNLAQATFEDHANPRASLPQRIKQSSGELASAAAKTRTGDANISIIGKPSTVPLSFLCDPQSLRAASDKTHRPCNPPPSHIAFAHWKSVTGVTA